MPSQDRVARLIRWLLPERGAHRKRRATHVQGGELRERPGRGHVPHVGKYVESLGHVVAPAHAKVPAKLHELSIFVSLAAAVITGVAFGLYPAYRAALLDSEFGRGQIYLNINDANDAA